MARPPVYPIRLDRSDSGARDAAVAERAQLVSFDSATRSQRQSTVRATAMVFHDPAAVALKSDLDRIAPSKASVLIIGETGAGKELVARYIHGQSGQASGPFIAVNCGALSDSLAEAELFGHEKGAFTGALQRQIGWFEAAHRGTLFLDEIGDLPLPLQVKLLRVLQEREVVRVGSRTPIPIDIRVIAATNVDLDSAIAAKSFREDLYFRLNVASVTLPPLRERPGDIEPLARYFLALYRGKLGRGELDFTAEALSRLRGYGWPGNIRELENAVHNAILLARDGRIAAADLRLSGAARAPARAEAADLESIVEALVERAILSGEPAIFERIQRASVRAAYDLAESNQVRAAAQLGLSRNAFRTQLSHLGAIAGRKRAARASETGELQPGEVGSPALGGAALPLRIGVQNYGVSCVLKARGALQAALAPLGVRIDWKEFICGPSLLRALDRGEIDYCVTGEAPPIFAQAAGIPFVYAGVEPPAPQGQALVARGDSFLRSGADLRGRRIAVNQGSNVHYLLLRALQRQGMTLDDVSCLYLAPDEALWRLLRGDIDAWAIWDPILSAAQIEHELRVVVDGRGLAQNMQFHLASTRLLREHPQILAALLAEVRRLETYIAAHPGEIALAMAPDVGLPSQALEIALRRLDFGVSRPDETVLRQQQQIADAFFDAGVLTAAVQVRDAACGGLSAAGSFWSFAH